MGTALAVASAGTPRVRISHAVWGKSASGENVLLYKLTNQHGLELAVTTYGARIVSLRTPDRTGRTADIVLGFDRLDGYLAKNPYFGATVGRYGNRIGKAEFTLDGVLYKLARNDGVNSLHGGDKGFDTKLWGARQVTGEQGASVEMTYSSSDGEEGYPGNLSVRVTYTLTEQDEVRIDYWAKTDKPTVVNLTNHAYFNLAGDGDVLGHKVMLASHAFTPIDAGLIPTGETREVKGTPFDFTVSRAIGDKIGASDEQLRLAHGYDHNWIVDGPAGKLRLAARVVEERSGRTLEVLTTEPGLQFYSGNFLDGSLIGKGGKRYAPRSGFCLETQHYPDSPNQPQFPTTELRPSQTYHSVTVYRMSART
jgi:aldose 1-epimerase